MVIISSPLEVELLEESNLILQNNSSRIIDNMCYQLAFKVSQCGYKFWYPKSQLKALEELYIAKHVLSIGI